MPGSYITKNMESSTVPVGVGPVKNLITFLLTEGRGREYKKAWRQEEMIAPFWPYGRLEKTGTPFPFFWAASNKKGYPEIFVFSLPIPWKKLIEKATRRKPSWPFHS